ncbi:MAG: ABC transporter ATP-binding protein [Bacteroidetes bacterium]|nr:ABC transporter ATP-binding protein [Bacteroidota bacterium]MCH7770981.1 ABC transporter ATP-binding protein [Bacteroidota bacterium]
MSTYSVEAIKINKTFGRRLVFNDINFRLDNPGIFGISGPNGSGKSTLVKIIAGLLSSTKGKITHKNSEKEIIPEKLHNHIGFVSPYLVLYEEFSAWENLNYLSKIRGITFDKDYAKELLERFLLYNRRNDLVKTYSSGMKQRIKFIFALIHHPELLIFDEPTSNLDDEGRELVYNIINDKSKENILIIASNDKSDLDLCTEVLDLKVSNKDF